MAALEAWEVKKKDVIRQLDLLDATELTEICGMLAITVPPAKAGKQSDIFNLIMAHIISDDVANSGDQGLSLFTDVDVRLKDMVSKKVKLEDRKQAIVTAEVTQHGASSNGGLLKNSNQVSGTMPSSGNAAGGSGADDLAVRLHSLNFNRNKDFKVHGGFVASGDSPISYSNLKFQIENGREQGYNDNQIMSGIVLAMKPNSKVKSYFESCPRRMPMVEFLRHVKSHYKLSDSSTLLTQLSGLVQGPSQKVQEFIDQLAQLRNDAITISEEEGNPLDPEMVKRRFRHALSVGLRKETIRVEIQAILKNEAITDVELGEQVQLIEAREEEHEKKMEESTRKGKGVSVNFMSAEERSAESRAIFDELGKLSTMVNEISVSKSSEVTLLKEQMAQMENRLSELGGSWNAGHVGYDGATYFDNCGGYYGGDPGNSRGGGHGNRGGGQGSRGASFVSRGGGFVANRGGGFGFNRGGGSFAGNGGHGGRRGGNRNNNRGGYNDYRGGYHGYGNNYDTSYDDYYQNDSYYDNNDWNNYDNTYDNNYNNGYAFDSSKRGAFGGNRGSGGNRGGTGGNRGAMRGGQTDPASRGGNRGGNRGGHAGGRGGHSGGKKFPFKCEECHKTGAHCTHCTYCGESDHKWANCPKNS